MKPVGKMLVLHLLAPMAIAMMITTIILLMAPPYTGQRHANLSEELDGRDVQHNSNGVRLPEGLIPVQIDKPQGSGSDKPNLRLQKLLYEKPWGLPAIFSMLSLVLSCLSFALVRFHGWMEQKSYQQ